MKTEFLMYYQKQKRQCSENNKIHIRKLNNMSYLKLWIKLLTAILCGVYVVNVLSANV